MPTQLSDAAGTQSTSPSAEAPPQRHGGRITLGIVVLVSLIAAGGWWLTHPNAFGPAGNLAGIPGRVEQPLLFGTGLFPDRDVEVIDVRPATTPPPGVEVTFHACSSSIGAARGEPENQCDTLAPVKGLLLEADDPQMHIIARVVLHESGVYRSKGFVVTYRDGLRRGSQTGGTHIKASTYLSASGS